jgi:capsular polysaccharide biosynthesis protein
MHERFMEVDPVMESLDAPPATPLPTTQDVLAEILARTQPGSVLCLAHDLPDSLVGTQARLVLLGSHPPDKAIASHSVDFRKADTHSDLRASLEWYVRQGERFDLIFIDHDHRLNALIEQIKLADALAHDATIWLFDDAVPPTLAMATDEPSSGWWVGSVWLVPQLRLFGERAATLCVDTHPTGVFAAVGRPAVDRDAVLARAAGLRGQIASVEQLHQSLDLANGTRLSEFIDHLTQLASQHRYVPVRPAGEAEYAAFAIGELAAEERFVRSAPVVFADLSGGSIEHRFDAPEEVPLYGQSLLQFAGATLIGNNSIVIDGVYYCRYSKVGPHDLKRIASDTGYGNDGTGLIEVQGTYRVPRAKLESVTPLPGRHLLVTPDERDNWGMWLLVTVPSVIYYLEHRAEYSGLMCYSPKTWQIDFLRFLGVDDAELSRQVITTSYAVDRLDIISRGSRNLCVTEEDRRCFAKVVQCAATVPTVEGPTTDPATPPRRIYVSRLTASRLGYRMMVEEAELIRRLVPLGFVVVEPERLTFAEQIRVFHHAEVIVGPGGAGMFNAVFARPGSTIVTIEGSPQWVHSHANLFATCGLNYGVILGRSDETDSQPVHKRWHIDVEAVIETLLPLL